MPEPSLIDLLREIRNLSYLFPAFVIVLLGIFFYALSLSQRQASLMREIEALRESLDRRAPGGGPE
ncbi:MAG: CcmD family protein [Anaerolineae bacterium]|nr:CcmD family protein [Anaerolineae bacterium]